MGIKTTILKKKLENTASPMELFIIDKLYNLMADLVKTNHAEESDKLKLELKNYSNEFFVKFKELSKELESTIQSDTKSKKEEAIQAIARMMVELNTFKTDCLAKIDEHNRTVTAKADNEVAKILNNIEDFRGPQGVPGAKGDKGNNGSPDTAEQVVAKVNEAKGVKITAIDGLEEELKKAKKGGGKAGGGMGNVQHETKAISAGTTSVNLTYAVAAGGRAAWLYYQGQFLVYGTHYTIAGSTVTLSFDKVNGTFLDITYIRG
jgi:hypothetical protein